MTRNRELSQLGEYVGVNTITDTVSFNSIVTASSGFVGSSSTTTPPVKIDIIGNTIRFSVVGIGSTALNLV
jgi:hypothetical protein